MAKYRAPWIPKPPSAPDPALQRIATLSEIERETPNPLYNHIGSDGRARFMLGLQRRRATIGEVRAEVKVWTDLEAAHKLQRENKNIPV